LPAHKQSTTRCPLKFQRRNNAMGCEEVLFIDVCFAMDQSDPFIGFELNLSDFLFKHPSLRTIYTAIFFWRYLQIVWLLTFFRDSLHVFSSNLYRFFSVKSVHICFDFWLCDLTSKQIWRKSTNQGAALQNKNKLSSPPQLKIKTNLHTRHRKKTVESHMKKCGGRVKKHVNSHRICKYLQKKTDVYMVLKPGFKKTL